MSDPTPNLPKYHAAYESIFTYALEPSNALLSPSANSLPSIAIPTTIPGYMDVPGIQRTTGASGLAGVACIEDEASVPGAREYTFTNSMRVGDKEFLRCALRSSNKGLNGKLPVVTVVGGVDDRWKETITDPETEEVTTTGDIGYSWVGRYGLFNKLILTYVQGQEVTAEFEIWCIALDEKDGLSHSTILTKIDQIAGILTWQHTSININGVNYRDFISGARLTINNHLRRNFTIREGLDDSNPLARTRVWMRSPKQTATLELDLSSKLPRLLADVGNGRADASKWPGTVQLIANNSNEPELPLNAMTVTIGSNRLLSEIMNPANVNDPNGDISFSISTSATGITIT